MKERFEGDSDRAGAGGGALRGLGVGVKQALNSCPYLLAIQPQADFECEALSWGIGWKYP
jgi:hypothetical protein